MKAILKSRQALKQFRGKIYKTACNYNKKELEQALMATTLNDGKSHLYFRRKRNKS